MTTCHCGHVGLADFTGTHSTAYSGGTLIHTREKCWIESDDAKRADADEAKLAEACLNRQGGPCAWEKKCYEHFGRHPAEGPCPAEAKLAEAERQRERNARERDATGAARLAAEAEAKALREALRKIKAALDNPYVDSQAAAAVAQEIADAALAAGKGS